MEVGGYVMLAIVAVLALGCINSSIKAHKNIFIPCGRGFHFVGRRFHTGKAHRGSAVRPFRSI